MMRDTPRCLVGSVTFRCTETPGDGPGDRTESIRAALATLPGVRLACVDGRTVTVTAERPTDRADIVQALQRAGCEGAR